MLASTADMATQMHRKLLFLATGMTCLVGLSYLAYFSLIGVWMSVARGACCIAVALAVLTFGLTTRRHVAALNTLSVLLFLTFGIACYFQDGIASPSLWWMITPPLISLLAGSLRIGFGLFAAFLVHAGVLYWHGPGSWSDVSLIARDRSLQTLLTVVFSTIFMSVFLGMGRHWLKQMQASLECARAEATDASEVKARFLSNMSHEIRTPLNGMIGATQILRNQRMTPIQRRQLLDVQEQSAKMLMSLVNDILDFSKLEAHKVQIEHAPVRLRSLLFRVNELFSVAAFERNIELTSSYDRQLPETTVTDATRIRQILSNLVTNAVKFTERGGVHIHLGFDAPRDDVRRCLRFDVTDTGPGIAEDSLERLFQPFEQADGSITRRFGGTGLGLSICNELAQLLDGRIEVESRLGKGSTFSLVVPLKGPSEPPVPEASPADAAPVRVLVATRSRGLWLHVKLQLDELGVDAEWSTEPPGFTTVYRARATCVVVDAQMLQNASVETTQLMDELTGTGMRIAVMAPLGSDALVHPYPNAAILYKPVRRGGLREFVFGDNDKNLRDSHDTPHGIESAFDDTPESKPPVNGPPLRVLVVEDNPVNQIVAKAMLDGMGAVVLSAFNGREAMDTLQSAEVDVVLMDIQMPVMDGITATRLLRERERIARRRATPVIALTGNNSTDDRRACLDAGMNSFLTKPYTFEQLKGALFEHGS
jgi:hypothetical protein